MTPCRNISSITAKVNTATIEVNALIDSGATTSCCSYNWYRRNKVKIGALLSDDTVVIGVGNVPINVSGRTQPIPLKWQESCSTISLIVVPTLTGIDVIFSMDILTALGVRIDAQHCTAEPTVIPTYVRPMETWKIPGRMSVIFSINNPFQHTQQNVLFEPSSCLPERIRSTPTMGKGSKLYIRLENFDEEEQCLNPEWIIGNLEIVEEQENINTEEGSFPEIPDTLTAQQTQQLQLLLQKYSCLFKENVSKKTGTNLIEHEIHTTGPPIRQPYRRQNPLIRQQEAEQLKEMLDNEIIRYSTSPWASPVVMVKKKDGTLRFSIDFRKLNDLTIKDPHPLPRIDDTLEALKGARYFSTLNLKSEYWQVPIKEEDKHKTAFRTSSGQLYEFNRLPFGLCNAPATFSRLMDQVLTGLSWEVCMYYLDDIIVFSATWEEHL